MKWNMRPRYKRTIECHVTSFLFIFVFLFFPSVNGASSYDLFTLYRSYPTGAVIHVKWHEVWTLWRADFLLNYLPANDGLTLGESPAQLVSGFLGVSLGVSSAGLAEGELSFYPLSFLKTYWSESTTRRFYDLQGFDCKSVQCDGDIRRQKRGFRLGFKWWNFIIAYGFEEQDYLNAHYAERPAAIEGDLFLLNKRQGRLLNQTFFLGRDIQSWGLGLMIRQQSLHADSFKNHASYLVIRKKHDENWQGFAAFGIYDSPFFKSEFSSLIGLEYKGGERLTPF